MSAADPFPGAAALADCMSRINLHSVDWWRESKSTRDQALSELPLMEAAGFAQRAQTIRDLVSRFDQAYAEFGKPLDDNDPLRPGSSVAFLPEDDVP